MVMVTFFEKAMKKLIAACIAGFAFSYCNPSQQAEQTRTDSARRSDSTTKMTNPTPSASTRDTTKHPDTSKPLQ
jgi:hypothetical protein